MEMFKFEIEDMHGKQVKYIKAANWGQALNLARNIYSDAHKITLLTDNDTKE